MDAAQLKLLAKEADEFLEARGYEVSQKNGQRVSVYKREKLDKDDGKCREVFVGKLPRDIYEHELIPAMEQCGTIYKMRLMMDFSGSCRGYGFVMYMKSADAAKAVTRLNGAYLRPGAQQPIAVCPSFDNKSLYMGGLPYSITRERLLAELRKVVEDVEDAQLPDCGSQNNHRYAFVKFKSHEAATGARRILCPGVIKIMGRQIKVDWARPETPVLNMTDEQRAMMKKATNNSGHSAESSSVSSINTTTSNVTDINSKLLSNISISNSNYSLATQMNRLNPLVVSNNNDIPITCANNETLPLLNLSSSSDQSLYTDFWRSPSPPPSMTLQPTPSGHGDFVLGETARFMLAQGPPAFTPRNIDKVITISNINPLRSDTRLLKRIFELDGQLQIVDIMPAGIGAVTIEYATIEQAELILEALILMPKGFEKLAQKNQFLMAQRGAQTFDLNANYQLASKDNHMPFIRNNIGLLIN